MRIRELIKKYDGKTVVDSVSFELPKGRVTSFIVLTVRANRL